MLSFAMVGMLFSSCKKDKEQQQNIDDIVENGFYVVGEAAGYAELNVLCQFAPGRNEANNNELRDGMYEKYIVLEAGKEFYFAKKEGQNTVNYGAELTYGDLPTDAQDVKGYKGSLAENLKMKVNETGLYHIVLDFDQDGALKNVGGPQIVLAQVEHWGLGGSMNGWGYTQCDKAENYVYTWENVEIPGGSEFKFKNLGAWKLNLDDAELVKANTNIGADGVPGGNNITVADGAVYTVKLTYALAKGDIGESFKYELIKVGDLALDPATFVVGISGTMNGWGDPSGLSLAKFNEEKTNITDAATKAGTYVFTMTSMTFPAESAFKFRCNGAWLGLADVTATGVTLSEVDGNIAGVEGTYDIEISFKWDGNAVSEFSAAFAEGTPLELVDIAITATVPETWTKCYIWAWDSNGNIFDAIGWPGQELEINAGQVAYQFTQVAAPLNVIFSNGDGAQTNDITDVKDGDVIDIAANLK